MNTRFSLKILTIQFNMQKICYISSLKYVMCLWPMFRVNPLCEVEDSPGLCFHPLAPDHLQSASLLFDFGAVLGPHLL